MTIDIKQQKGEKRKKGGGDPQVAMPSPRATPRGRPTKFDGSADRSAGILDAAEALFAAHGFYGVTVRQVANEAGVDPALLSYYFESKRGLFDAVFSRRAELVNERRMESMRRYEASTAAMTVEGCLTAFLEPVLYLWEVGGDKWRNYLRLVALVNSTPSWGGTAMNEFFDPVIERLIELLKRVLPEARDEDLYWCYNFASGALSLSFADTGRIDKLSGGLCRSGDVAAVRKRLSFFLATGTSELCRRLADGS
ncbi:MAG TPA: TetR/AcrR family transcriptional regulator [Sphingopyxis sp.]|uniref:TetR/AcrR family transcriptional regulator n=1 Tax=Sphingopyxis sp. TaxID=1908224 RepID=UPI002B9599B0|nr:TetR/AcrR family transcriptional regulator [Sphingopyxis sp.]HWW57350.1 TetR/AcrR family transcriptional regulator [Sphingopyxis sp.]